MTARELYERLWELFVENPDVENYAIKTMDWEWITERDVSTLEARNGMVIID